MSNVQPATSTSRARPACVTWSGCGGGSTTAPPVQSTTASRPSWPVRASPLQQQGALSGQAWLLQNLQTSTHRPHVTLETSKLAHLCMLQTLQISTHVASKLPKLATHMHTSRQCSTVRPCLISNFHFDITYGVFPVHDCSEV